MHYDVVIIGGGAIGASVAYFLRRHPKACSVVVVERDKSYQQASTPRASGGVRRLFALPENIALSNFSIPFYERFESEMAVDGEPARIDFRKNGYLFIVAAADIGTLEKNFRIQQDNGVNVVWLDREGLKSKFPSMNVTDLAAAVYSPDDGWLDPYSVLRGLRRKAASLGATFIDDEVVGLGAERGRVRNVTLKSGAVITTDHVVNAAGAWAKQISAMVGMRVPIEPMRRYEHYFECETAIEPLPYLKDTQRLAFRPEGKGYSGGVPDTNEPRGFNFEVQHDYFETVVWPALAHRFPAFERTKEKNVMAGLYDQNELDGNVIIGPWTGAIENFYMLAGFSGHGLMHAPGCGRAMAELILDGGYRTIDLGRFGWQRVLDGTPCRETGII
ncbi:FAD-dependent oxidoreductase [Bradyrhizobium sp. LTSP885]|uniref:NAD(P)/FAD-dependent oxidoreductase n=1 Tax=Bradyrhizobium sp. LTSP885 TaxID=1619232 RepID=UPI0005CB796E|nr:FAD-binding oxidoreductase [Bradyrhizobium sp. LTSP885]KJC46736.1 FAD-dependent oxidoreductase [Bradyrhizobium sp. LTSP885]